LNSDTFLNDLFAIFMQDYTANLPTSPESTTATIADDTVVAATDSDPAIASHKLQGAAS
jgi:hypothetical protein